MSVCSARMSRSPSPSYISLTRVSKSVTLLESLKAVCTSSKLMRPAAPSVAAQSSYEGPELHAAIDGPAAMVSPAIVRIPIFFHRVVMFLPPADAQPRLHENSF